jgi:hypothetical protein
MVMLLYIGKESNGFKHVKLEKDQVSITNLKIYSISLEPRHSAKNFAATVSALSPKYVGMSRVPK